MEAIRTYDAPELSKILKVSVRTAHEYLGDGRIRAGRVGRKWVIQEESVRAFLVRRIEAEAKRRDWDSTRKHPENIR